MLRWVLLLAWRPLAVVQAHDLALLSLAYGHMLGGVQGEGHWYRGNFEGRLELFGGGEYSPSNEWVIGLTPHLRYNFATGSPWIPFLDGGAGVTATGIGRRTSPARSNLTCKLRSVCIGLCAITWR